MSSASSTACNVQSEGLIGQDSGAKQECSAYTKTHSIKMYQKLAITCDINHAKTIKQLISQFTICEVCNA